MLKAIIHRLKKTLKSQKKMKKKLIKRKERMLSTIEEPKKSYRNKAEQNSQKRVIILGDSFVKHINGWEMSRNLKIFKINRDLPVR